MTVQETVQETVQDTVQTVQDTMQGIQETVQETVQTTAERAADALEETAERLRAQAPDPGRHFPWRLLLLTAGIAGAAVAVAQTMRKARARWSGPEDFPDDMPADVPVEEARARIDRSVESA